MTEFDREVIVSNAQTFHFFCFVVLCVVYALCYLYRARLGNSWMFLWLMGGSYICLLRIAFVGGALVAFARPLYLLLAIKDEPTVGARFEAVFLKWSWLGDNMAEAAWIYSILGSVLVFLAIFWPVVSRLLLRRKTRPQD